MVKINTWIFSPLNVSPLTKCEKRGGPISYRSNARGKPFRRYSVSLQIAPHQTCEVNWHIPRSRNSAVDRRGGGLLGRVPVVVARERDEGGDKLPLLEDAIVARRARGVRAWANVAFHVTCAFCTRIPQSKRWLRWRQREL